MNCLDTLLVHCDTGLPSDVEHFLQCGANRVLLKPLDFNAFTEAMREMEGYSIDSQTHVNGGESPRWDRKGESEGEWAVGCSREARDALNFKCSTHSQC